MDSIYGEWRAQLRRKACIESIGRMYAGPRIADPRITEPAMVRAMRLIRQALGFV